jgi:hypothetical protein
VVEGCHGARFALEASQEFGIAAHGGGEDFKRYIAAQLGVGGPIDFTHPARTYRGSNLIVAEPASDQSDLLQERSKELH